MVVSQSAAPVDVSDVRLNGSDKHAFMHTLTTGPPEALPIVCMPGYAAGAAFYFRNFAALGQNFRIYAGEHVNGAASTMTPMWRCLMPSCLWHGRSTDCLCGQRSGLRRWVKLSGYIQVGA